MIEELKNLIKESNHRSLTESEIRFIIKLDLIKQCEEKSSKILDLAIWNSSK